MAKILIKSQIPLTNWYIETYIRNCGYCELLERKFKTYSSDKFCEFELYVKVPRIKIIFLRHDLNNMLKEKFNKKCKKSYTIERARK